MQYLKDGYIRPDTTTPGLQKARECLRVLSMTDDERKASMQQRFSALQATNSFFFLIFTA